MALVGQQVINEPVRPSLAAKSVEEHRSLRPLPSLRPPLRLGEVRTVDRTGMVRFASGRYAVPSTRVGQPVEIRAEESVIIITTGAGTDVVRHTLVAPGEVAWVRTSISGVDRCVGYGPHHHGAGFPEPGTSGGALPARRSGSRHAAARA
jgi:hypothetical protein